MTDLTEQTCAACEGWAPALSDKTLAELHAKLDPDWELDKNSQKLSRTFRFKAFAKAVYTANLAAFISDKEGHHGDVAFGWGYCTVTFTSHELGRLSENDFICAAKLDAAVG